jgi:ribonuclease HI
VPAKPSTPSLVAYIDGGSRGNPGPAGYGAVIRTLNGSPVASLSQFLGTTTNNFAEYQALLAVLRYALEHGHRAVEVVSDSELLVRQIAGGYKVRSPYLRPLWEEARQLIARLESFHIRHVLREENRAADRLANKAMDAGEAASGGTTQTVREAIISDPLHASATFRDGRLEPDRDLPLREGEIVELEIRRKQ